MSKVVIIKIREAEFYGTNTCQKNGFEDLFLGDEVSVRTILPAKTSPKYPRP